MDDRSGLDIYTMVSRNRLRLAAAVAAFALSVAAASAAGAYLFYRIAGFERHLWLMLVLFWVLFAVYALLRYALGGTRIVRGIDTLPPWGTDRRLSHALGSALLASGIGGGVRLLVIPNEAINSFSISLPDGSHAVFATQGIADKLPQGEREAVMAHEVAHIQSGDALINTFLLRLAGARALRRMSVGINAEGRFYIWAGALVIAALALLCLVALSAFRSFAVETADLETSPLYWIILIAFVAAGAALLPRLMYGLLRLLLDGDREYHADLEAAFLTRDPSSIYGALKAAAEDVMDLLWVSSYVDPLLFHPMVSYTSYNPFQTQPTMSQRMRRIEEAFPQVTA